MSFLQRGDRLKARSITDPIHAVSVVRANLGSKLRKATALQRNLIPYMGIDGWAHLVNLV